MVYSCDLCTNGRSRDLFLGRNRRGVRALVVSLCRDKIDSQKLPRPDRSRISSRRGRYRELRRVPQAHKQPWYTCKFSLSLYPFSSSFPSHLCPFISLPLAHSASSGISVADRFNPWVVSATVTGCNPTPNRGYPVSRGFPPWLLDSTHRRRYTRPGIESGHCMSPPPKGRTLRRHCVLRLLERQEVVRALAKK